MRMTGWNWANEDVRRMADDLAEQADKITDMDDDADLCRAHLHRAIAHLSLAYAELVTCPPRIAKEIP